MNLSYLIIIPLVTAMAVLPFQHLRQVRIISLAVAVIQLVAVTYLAIVFWQARSGGEAAPMLFERSIDWYAPLGFAYHTGVDGISVSMLLLTAFVVLAGVLVSWRIERLSREFF